MYHNYNLIIFLILLSVIAIPCLSQDNKEAFVPGPVTESISSTTYQSSDTTTKKKSLEKSEDLQTASQRHIGWGRPGWGPPRGGGWGGPPRGGGWGGRPGGYGRPGGW
ncbi:hypothetical protein L9F63_006452 [Diploptera punctata]|uniref:Uncharacterized protein n=1 Tax=Diploptera punctata TaxID=6984 RepID=A0AAD8E4K2_DIPPU|nr:hypothetical protein L9F63_006452 [Diploptera punctata]